MSMLLAKLRSESTKKNPSREEILALRPAKEYKDGRTKQSFKDETSIEKIMARADATGTISHLEKHEGVYADFSDFDFHKQNNMLARGREIFEELPAELRKEFGQSPARFFKFVNDPENVAELRKKLPALAKPGKQNIRVSAVDADTEAVLAAVNKIAVAISASAEKTGDEPVKEPEATKEPDSGS